MLFASTVEAALVGFAIHGKKHGPSEASEGKGVEEFPAAAAAPTPTPT